MSCSIAVQESVVQPPPRDGLVRPICGYDSHDDFDVVSN